MSTKRTIGAAMAVAVMALALTLTAGQAQASRCDGTSDEVGNPGEDIALLVIVAWGEDIDSLLLEVRMNRLKGYQIMPGEPVKYSFLPQAGCFAYWVRMIG